MVSGLFWAAAAAPVLGQSGPTIAFGQTDLTPPESLPLGGYTERGEKKGVQAAERLMGRFAVLRQGQSTIVVGCLEMLTLPEGLLDAVRSKIPKEAGLFLAATHTHSAPDSQMLNPRMNFRIPGIAPYSSRWLSWYTDRIAGGINQALAAPPAPIASMSLSTGTVDANRARRPMGRPNKEAATLWVNGRRLLGVYAAHPTLHEASELEVSGDWPGAWMRHPEGPWIAFTGAIGDVSPAAAGATGGEKCKRLVENLVENGEKVRKFRFRDPITVGLAESEVQLGAPEPHPNFARDQKIDAGLARIVVSRFAPPTARITTLRLGSFILAGVPGEPTSGVERRMATTFHMAGRVRARVLSHVNGWAGYMLEPDDYASGGYEAGLSFYGPRLAPRLAAALDVSLGRLGMAAADAGGARKGP